MTYRWVGKAVSRPDARDKVTGATRYMSDLNFPDMLWGKVLRSPYPHALIKAIDTSAAEKLKGVHAVLTARDVPGLNGYGIDVQDQPALAGDKVRFAGDAVALVAAETQELAQKALELIKVTYEELPVVDSVEKALAQDAPPVHEKGNIHLHTQIRVGDLEEAMQKADLIVENTYRTPRQMPAFLETEGGTACFDGEILKIWCGSQYPDRDRLQISRCLNLNPEKIQVVANPVGGGFGGKDEITVQVHLALLAFYTRRPVKLVLDRDESTLVSWKRHPMKITMKTAALKDGTLLANEVVILADTGAYASLGGPIVNLAVEHACGAYRVPNVAIDGYCLYTNNGVAGAMRGFGVNQVTFAMETQMEILAEKLRLDPLEIRLKNVLATGDIGALGQKLTAHMGCGSTLRKAAAANLWQEKEQWKAKAPLPWIKRGVGVACAIQGTGLGVGLPDTSRALLKLCQDGTFQVRVGCPEIGQGNTLAYALIAAEALGCDPDRIEVITGDTSQTPDSGTTTASRSVYAGGNAIMRAAEGMLGLLKSAAARILKVPEEELQPTPYGLEAHGKGLNFQELALEFGEEPTAEGQFDFPTADKAIEGAFGLPHLIYSAITHLAAVEVNTLTGETRVVKIVALPDAGRVINRQGLEGQAEGGAVMGMGYALTEDVLMQESRLLTKNFSTYILPTALDVPEVETIPIEEEEPTGPFGAKGIGETVSVAVTPAITNAIHDAVGVWLTELPASAEMIYKNLKKLEDTGGNSYEFKGGRP